MPLARLQGKTIGAEHEMFFSFVEHTIEKELPGEIRFLQRRPSPTTDARGGRTASPPRRPVRLAMASGQRHVLQVQTSVARIRRFC